MIHSRFRAAGLLAVALLAACSGPDLPAKPWPPPSTSAATSSAAPTPTSAPSTPAERKAEVEAAVRRYFADVNKAISTGDTADLIADSTPTCPCRKLATAAAAAFRHGSVVGAKWALLSVHVYSATAAEGRATAQYRSAPSDVVDQHGRLKEHDPGHLVDLELALAPHAGGWALVNEVLLRMTEVSP